MLHCRAWPHILTLIAVLGYNSRVCEDRYEMRERSSQVLATSSYALQWSSLMHVRVPDAGRARNRLLAKPSRCSGGAES